MNLFFDKPPSPSPGLCLSKPEKGIAGKGTHTLGARGLFPFCTNCERQSCDSEPQLGDQNIFLRCLPSSRLSPLLLWRRKPSGTQDKEPTPCYLLLLHNIFDLTEAHTQNTSCWLGHVLAIHSCTTVIKRLP